MGVNDQDWSDEEFCALYESTWEISTDDVHYGWLALGESELSLLSGITITGARILDIGCGMGQNLIALAKRGAKCVGVDISRSMIRRAESIVKMAGLENSIDLKIGDMRNSRTFDQLNDFDVVLSVYSMEYLSNVRELRKLLYTVHKKLKPGGVFVFCFSHPSQASRYPELMNSSIPIGVGKYRTFNYSFKDVTEGIFKSGFTIERVVEQGTRNPSRLSYEDSKKYPYHFSVGMNPCKSDFDELSNGAPHTVIYKVRRHHDPLHGLPRRTIVHIGYKEVWGYKRTIIKSRRVDYLGLAFDAHCFAPMDNVLGLMDVLNFSVTSYDVESNDQDLLICAGKQEVYIDGNSVLGLIHRKLVGFGLEPIYKESIVTSEEDEFERKAYLSDIVGLGDVVRESYKTSRVGILVFVNGQEPLRGELPVDQILASPGDSISLTYVALSEADKAGDKQVHQLKLL